MPVTLHEMNSHGVCNGYEISEAVRFSINDHGDLLLYDETDALTRAYAAGTWGQCYNDE